MDKEILSLLYNHSNYKRYFNLIKDDRLSEDYRDILRSLGRYYDDTENKDIDWLSFATWYTTLAHPSLANGKASAIVQACKNLSTFDPACATAALKNLATRYHMNVISEKAFEAVEGVTQPEDVRDALRAYNMEVKNVEWDIESLVVTDDQLAGQLEALKNTVRYEWSVPELNLMLGPVGRGDFILLGARPDGGKTTFLASQAVHFAKQLEEGECMLWCNNEEPEERVAQRRVQAALNWTNAELEKDTRATVEAYRKVVGPNVIQSLNKSFMTVYDVEAAMEAYNPKIIIIDQIWKLGGFEKELSGIDRYAKLAQYVRDLAKHFGCVIGATQIDGTADNVKYPEIGTLYGSKTSVQGEADAILMIGQDNEAGADVRFLRAPKNKLAKAHPDFRSEGCAIKLDKERAQIISMRGQYEYQ